MSKNFFASTEVSLETDFKNSTISQAKSFGEIPQLSKFGLIASFLPGGQFYGKELQDLHTTIRLKYGNVFKFPSLFGRPSVVFAYDAEDFEKVIENFFKSIKKNFLSIFAFKIILSLCRSFAMKAFGLIE